MITLSRKKFFALIVLWWAFFLLLSIAHYNDFELLNIVGFLSLALVPGLLSVVALRLKGLPFWGYLSTAVGFSLLELMLTALAGNTILPHFGIARPLDPQFLLVEFSILVALLLIPACIRFRGADVQVKQYLFFDTAGDSALAFFPIVFVVMSIFGAIRLNDGASNVITMAMLGAMAAYIAVLAARAKKCGESVLPTAIFFMSFALLLMTSLRGWFVTGHDIQQETQFFEIAKLSGFWNVHGSTDAYNACLSITILPTVFANLLAIADQYIFKFFFQIFFALCPVIVYVFGRRWFGRRTSFLAALYFAAFPTFFTDMPFLVRQEIAFLFLGLMLYLVFQYDLTLRMRRFTFVVMGVGVILSHYSTTYTILAILGLAVIGTPLMKRIFHSARASIPDVPGSGTSGITILMVAILFVLSFLWTTTITRTGGQLGLVASQTLQAVKDGFAGNNRSIDAMSLLSFSRVDPTTQLQGYLSTTVANLRMSAPPGTYFATSTYSQYPIQILGPDTLPPTALARWLDSSGINFGAWSSLVGSLLGKLMEIFAPLGLAIVFFKKRLKALMDPELYGIAFFSFLFVAANVILPVLSAEYGVFRAMQQSLFVLGFFIAIGSEALGEWFASALIVVFFLYSTTVMPQLMGNPSTPALHLNNIGTYYDNYTTKGTEVAAEQWLIGTIPQSSSSIPVPLPFPAGVDLLNYSEFQSIKPFQSLAGSGPDTDIYPGLVKQSSYVFLGEGTIKDDKAGFDYNGNLIDYRYPVQFLDNNKDLIYNNGGSRVYK